jgi:uracil phosphoribosyltransferase
MKAMHCLETKEPQKNSLDFLHPKTTRFVCMRVHVASHPLITHKLTVLRDKNTPSATFRQLVEELVTLLAYEATRDVKVHEVEIETPLTKTKGVRLSHPAPLIVPVLRAGLGMLDGMMKLLPTAEVGFLGIKRNEKTLQPITYAERLPDDLTGRQVFIIDPMLATGGTLIDSINYVFERGAQEVIAVCLLGAPEGLKAVEDAVDSKKVTVVLGALDERLNEIGYIVPGLGDAGDRLYGLAE